MASSNEEQRIKALKVESRHCHEYEDATDDQLTSARRYQYFSAGRISIAPPRRAAGTSAATLIAASTFSASRTKYPPTAPRTSTKGPFVVSVSPFCTRTVVASSGSPSARPAVTPRV